MTPKLNDPNSLLVYTGMTKMEAIEYYNASQQKDAFTYNPDLPEKWEDLEPEYQNQYLQKLAELGESHVQEAIDQIAEDFATALVSLVEIVLQEIVQENNLYSNKNKEDGC